MKPIGAYQAQRRRRQMWRWLGLVWLAYLYYPLSVALRYDEPRRTFGVLAVVAYAASYALLILPILDRDSPKRRVLVWTMLALAVIGPPAFGDGWIEVSVFAGITVAILLEWRRVALVVGGLFAYDLLGSWLFGWGGNQSLRSVAMTLFLQFFVTVSVAGLIRSNRELREAHSELAQLAVADERLRFSRDLHDLLGHSLTTIVVKSELAHRLATRDLDRAVAEIADIERIARQSLADVRETVSGYRELSLTAELQGARAALGAAGVSCVVQPPERPLPGPVEATLAWVVREGTTNVLRHSRATACRIRLDAAGGRARLELSDNGVGPGRSDEASGRSSSRGAGLAGLAERVTAAGGRLETGPAADGGFRLCAEVPV